VASRRSREVIAKIERPVKGQFGREHQHKACGKSYEALVIVA
jgi:hypothetical protein